MVKMIMTYTPKMPREFTQNWGILAYMKTYGPITPVEALRACKSFRLSERIRELEALGWQIERGWFKTAGGARVRTYRLK